MTRSKKPFQPAPTPTCGGKNCYRSEHEADQVKQEQELRDTSQELQLKTYRCPFCNQWHLTRQHGTMFL